MINVHFGFINATIVRDLNLILVTVCLNFVNEVMGCKRATIEGWGVATPALFMEGLLSALLATFFWFHFPKPRGSSALEMTKIVLTVPPMS